MIPRRIRERDGLDGLVVLLGNTKGTLQRNVIEPMQEIYGSAVVTSIRSDNTAVIFGQRVHCLGADNKKRVDRLRGMSVKYCYGDEVVTWNEEVFEMLKSRLDKPYSLFDGTCNPAGPNHWFKKFIDGNSDVFSQNYRLDDNPFLDPEVASEMKRDYEGTVYYNRYILGEWVASEGLIYRKFADDIESFTLEDEPEDVAFCIIGGDFGDSGSAHAFNCTGFKRNLEAVITLDEYRSANHMTKESMTQSMDANDLADAFVMFARQQIAAGRKVIDIRLDSASQTLIRTIERALRKAGIGIPVNNAIKGSIFDRIMFYTLLFGSGRYKIMRNCKHTIDAFRTAMWNTKHPDERLDDGSTNIDSLDAQEYSTEPYQQQMVDILMLGGKKIG